MAKLSSDGTYVIVQKGDTLSEIAQEYGNGVSYRQLAAINNISNPDLIYVDQKIYLKSSSGSGASAPSRANNTSTATIKEFGYQSNSDDVLFATWTWGKSNTDHYEVEWSYYTGDGVRFIGNKSTTVDKQSTYTIPSNAKQVCFRVKPISKTQTTNGKETSYWTADWSTLKKYNTSSNPPTTPPVPTVEIDEYKLTASLNNLDVNANKIQFKVIKNDKSVFKSGIVDITTTSASYSCTIDAGGEYKVACRAYNGTVYSDWSAYSANVGTIPATPISITTCIATSATSVYLGWPSVGNAKSYTLEYTTKVQYFNSSDQTSVVQGIAETYYEKTGLESGQTYFFRVKAVNDKGESSWSAIGSVTIGKKPSAPTTWSSTTTVITGEDLTLYWIHNTEDGSSQTYAELQLYIDGEETVHEIENTQDEDLKDKTSFYKIDTSKFVEGTVIKWRVRTKGVLDTYSDWSIQRTVDVYAPTSLTITLLRSSNGTGEPIERVESFPIYIHGSVEPKTQTPISYKVSVIANESYRTIDRIGNDIVVKSGQEVYSRYINTSNKIPIVELSANNIELANNIEYTVRCAVGMNSGLIAEATQTFVVSWVEEAYEPNARISLDEDTFSTHISPFCKKYAIRNYRVWPDNGDYKKSTEVVDMVYGHPVLGAYTTTGEQVRSGITAYGTELYYCEVEESERIDGVSLSVYRREFDGSFTEIASGLDGRKNTTITDPHPSLDYARYRIVAVDNDTGAVSYCDLPGYPVGGTAAIIQWDEAWSSFDVTSDDIIDEPAWSGSMLKLPYNIDVSDSNSPDVELVEYIGREHPVGYYGTQHGFISTWNVAIRKDDEETLYAIRRLQKWMGNAYVREPSGSGYWANVKVSFSQKHRELTIPVTFNIARVEANNSTPITSERGGRFG